MALVPASSHSGALPAQWSVDAVTGGLTITGPAGGDTDRTKLPFIRLTDPASPGQLDLSYGKRDPAVALLTGADVEGFNALPGSVAYTKALLDMQSRAGTSAIVDVNGYVLIETTTAPADAALSAGSVALWLDATPGATKLMVKAKDSGGVVRSAAIALA